MAEIVETRKGDSEKWPYVPTIDKAAAYGAVVEEMDVSEVCVDADNKLVTTPAFMYSGAFHEIHDGVVKMVEKVIELIEVVESIE